MKFWITFTLIWITFLVYIIATNDYTKYKDRKCLVLDKMTTTGGYKSSGQFYLVLREERGILFDIIVSPSTFSQTQIGETAIFNLRQFDIKQTIRENVLYFFAPIIVVFLIGIGILGLIIYIHENK